MFRICNSEYDWNFVLQIRTEMLSNRTLFRAEYLEINVYHVKVSTDMIISGTNANQIRLNNTPTFQIRVLLHNAQLI